MNTEKKFTMQDSS